MPVMVRQSHAFEPQPPQRIFAAESAAIASASMLTAPCLPLGSAMLLFIASKCRSLPYLSIHCLSILSFQPHSQAACKVCYLHDSNAFAFLLPACLWPSCLLPKRALGKGATV